RDCGRLHPFILYVPGLLDGVLRRRQSNIAHGFGGRAVCRSSEEAKPNELQELPARLAASTAFSLAGHDLGARYFSSEKSRRYRRFAAFAGQSRSAQRFPP